LVPNNREWRVLAEHPAASSLRAVEELVVRGTTSVDQADLVGALGAHPFLVAEQRHAQTDGHRHPAAPC
jgi:hypothetical protein